MPLNPDKKRLIIEFNDEQTPTSVRISGRKHSFTYRLSAWGIAAALDTIAAYRESGWHYLRTQDRMAHKRLRELRKERMNEPI